VALAPYEVIVIPVNVADAPTRRAVREAPRRSRGRRDRGAPGRPRPSGRVKFKDADLVGFPLRVVIGEAGG